jgi:hypothetical protein
MRAVAARGRGLFIAGSIGMIAGGALHAVGIAQGRPPGAAMAELAMKAFTVTMGGMTWSLDDAYDAITLSYSATSIWAGVLGLVLVAVLRPTGRELATLAWVFAIAPAALAVIAGIHHIAPPLYVFAGVTALYVAAAWARNADQQEPAREQGERRGLGHGEDQLGRMAEVHFERGELVRRSLTSRNARYGAVAPSTKLVTSRAASWPIPRSTICSAPRYVAGRKISRGTTGAACGP